MRIKWTSEMESYLVELRKNNIPWSQVYKKMNKQFGDHFTQESCRSKYRSLDTKLLINATNKKETKTFKETEEINYEKGTGKSDKLIELSKEQDITEEILLKAHGYCPNEWQITKVNNSMWHHHNKQDGTKVLYASRIEFKQRDLKISDEKLLETITSDTKPINLSTVKYKVDENWMLEIPFMDMHFGINTLDDYMQTLTETIELLQKRIWQEVLITFGSDLMHVDNLKNTTANQTRIQDVDHVKMIEDVKSFYETLVTVASKQANKVKVVYIKGNHDETTSGLLVHWLDGRFKEVDNVSVDYSIEEVKVHSWEQIFVALSHGDKGGKRAKNILATKYPVEWANAKVREFHKGHLHHYVAKDEFGILERTLPTGAKIDQFHKDNSYEGAHQRFMLFEYSEDRLRHVHYV